MENTIRFYKPSPKFLKIEEHVVIGNDKDVLVILGPNGFDNEVELKNWIDTSAHAVIFKISIKYLSYLYHDISNSIEMMQEEIKETIKDYIERCNTKFDKKEKESLVDKIFNRVEQLLE